MHRLPEAVSIFPTLGLTVISTVVVLVLAGTAMNGGNGITGSTHSSYMLTVFADLGWWGFVSLFLGWLAVLGGAASEVKAAVRTEAPRNLRDIRPAA